MTPRPYQIDFRDAVTKAWETHRACVAVAPTGTGKTVTAGMILQQRMGLGKGLLLADRDKLITQARKVFSQFDGLHPTIEMAGLHADYGPDQMWGSNVVVTSVQTQIAGRHGHKRMERFNPNEFATLIVDEAHRSVAPSWRKVIAHYTQNQDLRVVGVTATPDRADGIGLHNIYEHTAYEYWAYQAVEDGWLVPARQSFGNFRGLDLNKIRTTKGDLDAADLDETLSIPSNIRGICDEVIERVGDRRCLIFFPRVHSAGLAVECLNAWKSKSARLITGESEFDDRVDIYEGFANGAFNFLVNVEVCTYGFDEPGIEVIVNCRPTKARSTYVQMIGRGLRPLPGIVDPFPTAAERRASIAASAKPWLQVLDFIGKNSRHKLCSVVDVLGGKYIDEVRERVRKRMEDGDCPADVEEACKEEQKRYEAEQERKRIDRYAAIVDWRTVDPFSVMSVVNPTTGPEGRVPPKTKTLDTLRKAKVPDDILAKLNDAQAGALAHEFIRRWRSGLCGSWKIIAQLKKRGLPTNVTWDTAREWMDKLAKNGWRLPPELVKFLGQADDFTY